jgi:hypothetical protein
MGQQDLKIWIILIHITDLRRDGYTIYWDKAHSGKFWGVLMSALQRLAAVIDTTANLITQLRELEGLRERVRKAELALRSRRVGRRKRTLIRQLAPSPNRSENPRSVSPT